MKTILAVIIAISSLSLSASALSPRCEKKILLDAAKQIQAAYPNAKLDLNRMTALEMLYYVVEVRTEDMADGYSGYMVDYEVKDSDNCTGVTHQQTKRYSMGYSSAGNGQ